MPTANSVLGAGLPATLALQLWLADAKLAATRGMEVGDGQALQRFVHPQLLCIVVIRARDAGPATSCLMQTPRSVTTDGRGGFYVTDSQYNTVRWVKSDGTISTIIGRWVYVPAFCEPRCARATAL